MFSDIDLDFGCECYFYSMCGCDLGEVSVGSSVDIAYAYNMTSCCQTLEDYCGGSGAGGEC